MTVTGQMRPITAMQMQTYRLVGEDAHAKDIVDMVYRPVNGLIAILRNSSAIGHVILEPWPSTVSTFYIYIYTNIHTVKVLVLNEAARETSGLSKLANILANVLASTELDEVNRLCVTSGPDQVPGV